MGQKLDTPKDFIKALFMDFSFWVLIITHLSVVGLVWYDGWHPLTLVWIYISQQIVQSLLDILWLFINPKLDVSGFAINGKPATDSKKDRKQSAIMVLFMLGMMCGFIFFFAQSGLGIPKGTIPVILTSTGIFAFQKLFFYFYIRLMDGPEKMDMGCLVFGPVITLFMVGFIFFLGQFVYFFEGKENPLSVPNLIFLVIFIFLKLIYDLLTFLYQKFGNPRNSLSSKVENMIKDSSSS